MDYNMSLTFPPVVWLGRKILRKSVAYNILVLGDKGVGKTTYLEQLRLEGIVPDKSPTVGRTRIKFKTNIGDGKIKIKCDDVGGEKSQWGHWLDSLRENKPVGIIFLVDHTSVKKHKVALTFLRNVLRAKKKKCKFMLFLINKSDIWPKTESFEKLRAKYYDELSKFRKEGFEIGLKVDYCSAKTGDNVKHTLSEVMKRFIWYY